MHSDLRSISYTTAATGKQSGLGLDSTDAITFNHRLPLETLDFVLRWNVIISLPHWLPSVVSGLEHSVRHLCKHTGGSYRWVPWQRYQVKTWRDTMDAAGKTHFFFPCKKGNQFKRTKTFHLYLMAIKSSVCVFTYMALLIPDVPLGFAGGCFHKKALFFGGGYEGVVHQMCRTHKSIGPGACSYVNVCPMEGKLAVRRAGEGRISRTHYATPANCI